MEIKKNLPFSYVSPFYISNFNMSSDTPSHTLALGEAPRGVKLPRVVVTGGSGKLGRATVSHLASQGWEVIK